MAAVCRYLEHSAAQGVKMIDCLFAKVPTGPRLPIQTHSKPPTSMRKKQNFIEHNFAQFLGLLRFKKGFKKNSSAS